MQAATPGGASFEELRVWSVGVWFAIVLLFLGSLAWAAIMARGLEIRLALRVARHAGHPHGGVRGALLAAAAAITCAFVLLVAPSEPLPVRGALVLITAMMTVVACQQGWRMLEAASQNLTDELEAAERLADQARERLRQARTADEALESALAEFSRLLECESAAALMEHNGHYRPAKSAGPAPAAGVLFTASSPVVKSMAVGRSARAILLSGRFDSSFGLWSRMLPDVAGAEQPRLDALGAQVLVPMKSAAGLRGFFTLGRRRDGSPYNASHLRVAGRVAQATTLALDVAARLDAAAAEAARQSRGQAMQEVAALMRWSMLPCDRPAIPSLDCHARCVAALEPTGAFVDLITLPDQAVGLVMAQSNQHGLPGVIHLSRVQAWLRSNAWPYGGDLVALAAAAERALAAEGGLGLFLGRFDTHTHSITYLNAGFPPPLLLRRGADGAEALRLPVCGPQLGGGRDGKLEQAAATLLTGDLLIAFSTGVVQTRNENGDRWGEGELIDTVLAWEEQSAADVVELVHRTIRDFTGQHELREDLALVLLRLKPDVERALLIQ